MTNNFIIKSVSELGIRAGRSCSAYCPLSPVVSGHCRRSPPFFPVIAGFGASHQAWPSPEGFEVQNPITRPHLNRFSVTQPGACFSCAGLQNRNSGTTPWLGLLASSSPVSVFRSSFRCCLKSGSGFLCLYSSCWL